MEIFNFNSLTTNKAHDPYQWHSVVSDCNLTSISKQYIKFFDYMRTTGYNEYDKKTFLANVIHEHGIELVENFKNEQESTREARNLEVAPDLNTKELDDLMYKFEGNLMEIIAGNIFSQIPGILNNKYVFERMCGNEKDDYGVDGWVHHQSNPKFKVGIQVKFRSNKDVKWNDQITKCVALTEETVRSFYRNGLMTDKEWCDWSKNVPQRAIIVTTTSLDRNVVNAIGKFAFDVIDADMLWTNVGKKHNTNPHREFWENCWLSIQ